jgi:flavin-dependent thymidylate synthase
MAGESIGLQMSSSEQANAPITNTPIVKLVHPPKPEDCLRQIATMWLAAHHVDPLWIVDGGRAFPGSFDPDHEQMDGLTRGEIEKMIWEEVIPIPAWQTVLECVRFTFVIYNLSRPAQQQLTRQRLGVGFNNNSLRVIQLETFARDGRYRMPPRFKGTPGEAVYRHSMEMIQGDYNTLISSGVKQEDARGILPQNIHSPTVTMFADLRALLSFIPKRLCYEAQDEMNEMAVSLKQEVDHWDHWFGNLLSFPCSRNKECVIGPGAAERCPLPYEWKGGGNKGIVITSHKEEVE